MKERTTEKAVSEKISAEEVVLDEIIVEETAATEIDAFPCDMCGSGFKSLRALRIHEGRIHLNNYRLTYPPSNHAVNVCLHSCLITKNICVLL